MHYVDANIKLRYILGDHDELSPTAKSIIEKYRVYVLTEVLAEVLYVLKGVYKIERDAISKSVLTFFKDSACELVNHEVIIKAVELYAETTLDFVDCVLLAYASVDHTEVHTFDKKLKKTITCLLSD